MPLSHLALAITAFEKHDASSILDWNRQTLLVYLTCWLLENFWLVLKTRTYTWISKLYDSCAEGAGSFEQSLKFDLVNQPIQKFWSIQKESSYTKNRLNFVLQKHNQTLFPNYPDKQHNKLEQFLLQNVTSNKSKVKIICAVSHGS